MFKIKLSNNAYWPFDRQTPNSQGKWGNYQFYLYDDIEECDYWIIYDALAKPEKVFCPVANTIFIAGEPPCIKRYHPGFLQQFAVVITCQKISDHPNVLHRPLGLPWVVNKTYDNLKLLDDLQKDRLVSVISSAKRYCEGHVKRMDFVAKLQSHFGNTIDVFGRGVNDIADKWDAISRYKYHIVIENCSYPDYWTEKITDAFLGCSYPIYYGCPNLADYFPVGSFTDIDINNVDASLKLIEQVTANNYYEQAHQSIMLARKLILDQYNLFPLLTDFCSTLPVSTAKTLLTINPENHFT